VPEQKEEKKVAGVKKKGGGEGPPWKGILNSSHLSSCNPGGAQPGREGGSLPELGDSKVGDRGE